MWSKFATRMLEILSLALASFLSYQSGKKSVTDKQKDGALTDAALSQKADEEIRATHHNDDWRKRMRNRFTIK